MEDHAHHRMAGHQEADAASYRPLVLVLAGIAATTVAVVWLRGDWSAMELMRLFMGFFFAVFAAFKFLDLRGFADAYAEYDLIASRNRVYAFAYPFIEAALAAAYLASWQVAVTNMVTLVVMLVSSAGVLHALLGNQRIRCACLGAVVKLPMTTVTLIEDLGMAAMAAAMLVLR